MGPTSTVLVVQHEDECPVGLIEPWLAEAGLQVEVLRGDDDRTVLPAQLGGYAGLIVLGGHMGANDDADNAWLAPTKALIATTVGQGRPFLGVCLGHQLASVALGGTVTPNPHGRTRRLLPVGATEAGAQDPLLTALEPGAPVLHWNDDVVVEAAPGTVPLAQAPDGTLQAVRLGALAWGVQFHPEVDVAIVRGWARDEEPEAEAQALATLDSSLPALHRSWGALVRRFGELAGSADERVA